MMLRTFDLIFINTFVLFFRSLCSCVGLRVTRLIIYYLLALAYLTSTGNDEYDPMQNHNY